MQRLVDDSASALKAVDSSGVRHKEFQAGIGPFGEPQLVKAIVEQLRTANPELYASARTKREPDLLIPNSWAIECKIIRPFGDNGKQAEHWSENLLHPYHGNVSALGDCLKLGKLNCLERKGVPVFSFEHEPPQIDMATLVDSFELVARGILKIKLGPRATAIAPSLVHPVHRQATVYGWEILTGPEAA